MINEKSALRTEGESCFPSDGCSPNSTLGLDYISIWSALGHSTRCLAETWLSSVDSLFCSRCRTCCSVGGRSSYMDPFLLLPALSRAEPEFIIRTWQAKPEGRQLSPRPSSFSMKNKSTSQSPKAFSLPRCISLPSSSLSFSGLGSIPLDERRQAFFHSPFWAPGLFWFEHRLKHT